MIALIALTDWRVKGDIPLGLLYLFPMLLVSSAGSTWRIAAVAGLCTFLTEAFDSFEGYRKPEVVVPCDILIFAAFFCMGVVCLCGRPESKGRGSAS